MNRASGVFLQAHNERLKDARALFKAGRWTGAVYLGGYAVECLLKAMIMAKRKSRGLGAEFRHHDLRRLAEQTGLGEEEFRDVLGLLCDRWSVTLRYESGRHGRHSAGQFLNWVERARRWLLQNWA